MGGQKKPKKQRKDERVLIRVSTAQKEVLQAAAEKRGLTLSSYVLTVALRDATGG